ncbi:amino acid adenylation domain-containing protein [Mycobacterium sp. M1]|uniref:Amino acid adenylation domain-containing protein n=1 Tax=Mycolicibacter acidiphilus TaxID=2835306 RepID=A0ABS5RJR4_9MYCO|nr:non-ribosomal peptide synthetase [Mycolicibacter acidiphilus]MBS9534547.1 amino acid adenylation domain-containing protein [Mycolicibacter acidiphilus]
MLSGVDSRAVHDRRRELLRRRLAERGLVDVDPTAQETPAAAPALRAGERYPLSPGQRRMWFLQALDAADTTLNIGVCYRLIGAVDPARLRRAFDDVVTRHSILRTRYGVDESGEPYQVFGDVPLDWAQQDRSDWRDAVTQDVDRPFDLTADPPIRILLIRTGAAEFVLSLVVHHICWDDDCWAVFFDELSRAYNGAVPDGAAPQYAAVFDRIPVPDDTDLDHWRQALHPLPDAVELPGHRAAQPTRRADHRTQAVPADLFAAVEEFARSRSASPFMVLLSAFGALVGRYADASDFLVAVPVTDRPAGTETVLGYFGNTLLLRLTGDPAATFASSVDAVRGTCLAGFAHSSVGIDRVIGAVNPDRAAGHDGLAGMVQLGFSMRKSANGFAFDGITAEQLEPAAGSAPIPLSLAVVAEPDGAYLELEYQADVLDGALVERFADHYLRLLGAALREPDRRLAGLDMLGPDERAAILAQSHGTSAVVGDVTMIALLEATAAARPDATALVAAGTELTYPDLHRRANRLARWLIGGGAGPEDVVGLQLGNSTEFIVAMLAVLKAGAGYLPIDPGYPADRIAYLRDDAAPRITLDPAALQAAERAAAGLPDTAVCDADRVRPLRPDNLAYVIYTSGTTGRPKGVAVTHAAVADHIRGFAAEWSMTAEDRLLQMASVSFDASAAEIFLTLYLGATLVLPDPDALGDVDRIAETVERQRVTVLQMVPSLLGTLLKLPPNGVWRQLRHLPVGGEALPGRLADDFVAQHPGVGLRNHYGPTEAVICATHQPVDREYGTATVPIGVPNRNVRAYVLDRQLQLVPTGVVGELYLGGPQLARGYLHRAGLTAQRFVADPFDPGARLYRSGDLVRRNNSGELEFVGRSDEQLKVRGIRVEPGEIESVLAGHPGVRDCRVVADGGALSAYLVGDADLDVGGVRAHAAAALPEYLVPGAFAVLDALPLTVGGKLDRRALPAAIAAPSGDHREPGTPTERRIAAIFAALFERDRIGADDSFFALGGHSLLAARLVAQLRAEFGVELAIRAVFETPTPAGLAARLVEQFRTEFDLDLDDLDGLDAAEDLAPGRPELVAAHRSDRIPLSYSQLAGWFQYRLEGAREAFAMPLTLRISGPLDDDALERALNDVAARHEALRTTFVEHDGVPYQVIHSAGPVRLTRQPVAPTGVDAAVAELRRGGLNPQTGPLIAAALLTVDAQTHTLAIIVHHLVCDHVSLGVIVDDLCAAYRARRAGQLPNLPDLPLQFADYALWQRNAFDTGDGWGQAELTARRDALAGLPDEVSIPPDRLRRLALSRQSEIGAFTVPAAQRIALLRLADDCGVTEFMACHAAVAVWLQALGAGSDIAIGSPAAARVEPGTEHLVGLLANAVVLRTGLTGDPSLRDVLTRSRDAVLDAFAHQEAPIERLVDAVKPARSGFRNPLYQTMIHYRGPDWSTQPRELVPGTTLTGVPAEFTGSLMDVDLGMTVTAAGELAVRVVANADLYEPATVAHLADALQAVFTAYATHPDLPLSQLRLLPDDVLAQVLAEPAPVIVESVSRAVDSAAAERILIALLEELLEIDDVDAEDNFFALGGDSITSIKWAAAAATHDLTMTPAMVFEHATIGELAVAVGGPAAAATDDRSHAPMSASGLDADALAQLTSAWNGRQ